PYFVQLGAEPDTAPLVWGLDTLGRPVGGIATVRTPRIPLLGQLVNAGAVAVDPAGDVYFAPLAGDEIRKYGRGGQLRWTAPRGPPAGAVRPSLHPPHAAGRHRDARRLCRQGDAGQLLGLLVRPLPRGVPPHGGVVAGVRAEGLRHCGDLG